MKILIIKTSALGDIIQAFPVLSYLKQKFPLSKITWIAEEMAYSLLKAHPLIDQVIKISTKRWRKKFFHYQTWQEIGQLKRELKQETYDLVIDLQGNSKSGLLCFYTLSLVKIGFGKKTVAEWPNLLFTQQQYDPSIGHSIYRDYVKLVQLHFQDETVFKEESIKFELSIEEQQLVQQALAHPLLQHKRRLMICAGAAWQNKQMTHAHLTDFLKEIHLQAEVVFIFIWGSAQEKSQVELLQQDFPANSLILDKWPLPVLQAYMQAMDEIISMDSLPLHLAATTSTPTFSIFGPSSLHKYKPPGLTHRGLQGVCPYGQQFEKRCPFLRTCPTGACLHDLTGQKVKEAFLQETNNPAAR